MRLATKLLSVFGRQAWWSEGHIFAFTPEQIGIVEGLRASVAIAAMLFLDLAFHVPDLAFGAVAAFWTCLCDPGGSDSERRKAMAKFALGATLIIVLAAFFAHWGRFAGGVALFGLVLLCGLVRVYRPAFGPMPTPPALLAAIAVVIGVTTPRDAGGALHLGSCFLLGSGWAQILCITIWRTHPRAPARRALVAIFDRLEEMAASLAELDRQNAAQWTEFSNGHRRAVRFSIERGRETVSRLTSGRTRFNQSIDAAGRVFAALMALGHHRAARTEPFDREEAALLDGLRRVLQEAIAQSDKLAPQPRPLIAQTTGLLAETANSGSFAAHAIAFAAEALAGLAKHWQEPETAEPAADAPAGGISFKVPAPVQRQALRVAVAVTVSYAIGALYDVSFSYWGTIATMVLMQPLGANTWLRVLERAIGTIVGGVLTAILIARLNGPVEMLLFIGPLSAVVIALRLVNYALFMIFLTPMFVLVSDFIHPASNLVATRAINEIIGAVIGLAGSLLLWPEKEDTALSDSVLAAMAANLKFAAAMLRSDPAAPDELDPLRREAGVTSARAEIARQRMMLQGRSAHLDRIRDILIALRAVCGAANVLAIMRKFESEGNDSARAERYEALAGHLREEFLGKDETAAITLVDIGGPDDLDHAVGVLAAAVRDYASEAHAIGVK